MNRNSEHLNFDNISFDDVDMDDIESTHLEDAGNIEMDLSELNDDNDIPASVPLHPKDQETIARNIEEIIISLMESGDIQTLLFLTGERPDFNDNVDTKLHMDFASEYVQACLFNPAIKWYAKLANILPPEQFNVDNGNLNITMPKDTFEKVILPFLGDFDKKFYEDSPLVKLVLDCSEKHFQNELVKNANLHKQIVKPLDEDAMELGDSELDGLWDTDEVVTAGDEMHVDDNNSLNQSEIKQVTAKSLKLSDLSNKAIANYMIEHKLSGHEASEKLAEEISDKARRNEIECILSYMKNSNNGPLQHLRPLAKLRINPNKDDFKWDDE